MLLESGEPQLRGAADTDEDSVEDDEENQEDNAAGNDVAGEEQGTDIFAEDVSLLLFPIVVIPSFYLLSLSDCPSRYHGWPSQEDVN